MYRLQRIGRVLQGARSVFSVAGEEKTVRVACANNASFTFKTGRLAKFADGAAVCQVGKTSVLVTAVSSNQETTRDFVPFTVDYRQKAAAAGRIPTNHLRREMGPTDHEILTSRAIDRSLRPMFPSGFRSPTNLTCNLLAVDGSNDPDVIAINAASMALCLSDIPFNGPVAACRVALIDNEVVVHPTRRQQMESALNLLISTVDHSRVVMIEAGAKDISTQDMIRSLEAGVSENLKLISETRDFISTHGKSKRQLSGTPGLPEDVVSFVRREASGGILEAFKNHDHDKISRDMALKAVRLSVCEKMKEEFPDVPSNQANDAYNQIVKEVFKEMTFDSDTRMDGRKFDEIRKIYCEMDLYEPLHGSALFQRGQTQVLCTVAFDSPHASLRLKDPVSAVLDLQKEKTFMLHYEFPAYATNEIGMSMRPGRRELGHGNLAEKALAPLIPTDFPFAIRLTSEVLESNGSSSMASVCGGCLALKDAGVPVTSAAGVAIGLLSEEDPEDPRQFSKYKIFTDILGIEDYLGQMDFKIAGSRNGITAMQADVKIAGLPLQVLKEAVEAGDLARGVILDKMQETLDTARQEPKDNWPVVEKYEVPIHRRSHFVGMGGRNIRDITADTGVTLIPVDATTFDVFAPNSEAMAEAKEIMDRILAENREPELEFGCVYTAKIVEILDSGVKVILFPTMMPTMLPNKQLDSRNVRHASALGFSVGDEIEVKYFGRDPASGSMRLSRRVLQQVPSTTTKKFI